MEIGDPVLISLPGKKYKLFGKIEKKNERTQMYYCEYMATVVTHGWFHVSQLTAAEERGVLPPKEK